MSVAIPITTAISAEAAPTPQLPSLWELGSELQTETVWIARLAERLDSEDDEERTIASADLEQVLAAEHTSREAFLRKADATCWVIERLRAEASYHASQSKRFSALARREDHRADALESTLIHLLSRLNPAATSHQLLDHRLTSRLSEAVEISDADALPEELITLQVSRTPDKSSIKARIRAAISAAIAGLPAAEAAHLAVSIAATAIPGARLIKRRNWSIT